MMKRTSKVQEEDHKEEKELELAIWDCGSPLYDSYELVSLSHLIERHLMILPSLGGSRRFNISRFSRPVDVGPPMKSNVGINTKVAKGSSMVASLSEFMERKMWKRKVFGQRKEKTKKMKITSLSGFYNRILPWKK
ncbi:hypothetical protein L484_002759 [Morus notabilis]|uniref:Uncharacterized protein n=1 Tax=Morus notabilis TaxID=981085 RepID=W9RN15_9ROSA|nr:hypothetical protein L484_002759 [Morus notabilis]